MPCSDAGYTQENMRVDEAEDNLALALSRNDELARLLCMACASLRTSDGVFPESLDRWYTEHLEHDRKRVSSLLKTVLERVCIMGASDLDELEKVLVNLG